MSRASQSLFSVSPLPPGDFLNIIFLISTSCELLIPQVILYMCLCTLSICVLWIKRVILPKKSPNNFSLHGGDVTPQRVLGVGNEKRWGFKRIQDSLNYALQLKAIGLQVNRAPSLSQFSHLQTSTILRLLERIDIPDLRWVSPRRKFWWPIKGLCRAKLWPWSQDTGSFVAATVGNEAESLSSGNLQFSGGKKIHQQIYCIMSGSSQQQEEKQQGVTPKSESMCGHPVLDEGSGRLWTERMEFWAEERTRKGGPVDSPSQSVSKPFHLRPLLSPHQYQRIWWEGIHTYCLWVLTLKITRCVILDKLILPISKIGIVMPSLIASQDQWEKYSNR